MRIIILGLALCSAMSIEAHFLVDDNFDPPVTNTVHNNTGHYTNAYSGRVYHNYVVDQYSFTNPPPYYGRFIADNFGDELLNFQNVQDESSIILTTPPFSGTSINFNNHQVSLSHSSGSLSLSGAAVESRCMRTMLY